MFLRPAGLYGEGPRILRVLLFLAIPAIPPDEGSLLGRVLPLRDFFFFPIFLGYRT